MGKGTWLRGQDPQRAARKGWFLVLLGLATTFYLASLGPVNPVAALTLSVVMGVGLVLGLNGLMSATARPAVAGVPADRPVRRPAVRRGAFGAVPASWEFYETFGR